jgi:Protein of unknown function (DUF3455)
MSRRSLLAVVAFAAAVALSPTAAQAAPSPIKVPAGNEQFLSGHANGVQIYACGATGWTFVAPRANLYDHRGRLIATHFAGPTWQATDGSKVVGKLVTPAPSDGTAIPWLLLSAASTTPGTFAETTFIQRVNTTGGLAPAATTCTATTIGTQREVPYTADYRFWKAKRCSRSED